MAGLSLEGKPWYFGLIIGLVLAILIVGVVLYMFINPTDDDIRAADAQLKDLDTKIEQGRTAQRKLPQFREEVNRLKVELKKLRSILPSTRNTEEIIKKIKALVDAGNFTLRKLTFPKLAAAQGSDPYAEWPISVSVDGRYHNLATLFNHLSNFTRIINVEQISIAALPQQTDRTITADFVAKTFVYVEPKEPEATPAKGAKK
ncbi:MAG TPA: type 4a pilus biogenesis protein PilO [Thermoanaerobaculia bacterium]|jgi:type IV pilus assembly protein PilO|nr:type 4a pilus biogenesis protein PilO [Thermoanaerobaculia bacterium]